MTGTSSEEVMSPESEAVSITPDTPAVVQIGTADVREMARTARERVQALRELITHAIDVTDRWDWVVMGGGSDPKVYLTGAGATKVARLFGINWTNVRKTRQEREDNRGMYYFYEYTATFMAGSAVIEETGTCTSKDPFFAKKGETWLPSSEVDETNVMKAAWTNCLTRGITALIGLRNFPLSRLPEKLREGAPRVDFKDGSQRGAPALAGEDRDKAKQIGEWLLELNGGDTEAAMADLEKRTAFTVKSGKDKGKKVRGKRSVSRLTPRQVDFLHKDLLEEVERFRAEQPGASGNTDVGGDGGGGAPSEDDGQPDLFSGPDGDKPPWDEDGPGGDTGE